MSASVKVANNEVDTLLVALVVLMVPTVPTVPAVPAVPTLPTLPTLPPPLFPASVAVPVDLPPPLFVVDGAAASAATAVLDDPDEIDL